MRRLNPVKATSENDRLIISDVIT